jgi:hypothetical protein
MNLIAPKTLLQLIGSFWKRIVARPLLSERLFAGLLAAHFQSEQKATDLVKSVSNLEVAAGETTTFEKFIFVSSGYSKFEYGSNLNAKYGLIYIYGDRPNLNRVYDIPKNIISIPILYDNPAKPTKTYTENIDYKTTFGKLEFKTAVPVSTILYAKKVVRDTGFTYRRLSYVIGVNLSDSIFRKLPLNEFWRLFSYGPNYYNMLRLVSLCANAPIAKHDNEKVLGVNYVLKGALVITDKEVYFVPANQSITIKVNQVLSQGDPISSGIEVLHYQSSVVGLKVPDHMKAGNKLKYGSKTLNPARVILLKADISGPEIIGLQYFIDTLPLEAKVILLANKTVPSCSISSFRTESTQINNSVLTAKIANNQLQITPKCTSSLKYSFYGF